MFTRLSLLLAASFLALMPGVADAQGPQRRPNIVFILADDLGINDLGCYGRKDQPTPNLDKLAKQGMRFTSAYSAAAICSPTRAAIMTGKSPRTCTSPHFCPADRMPCRNCCCTRPSISNCR